MQACGDCHLANFGVFATPERNLVFDINDFDETLPAPWEWDVKRLATSAVVAGRHRGFPKDLSEQAALAAARGYREAMAKFSGMRTLEVWYARLDVDDLVTRLSKEMRRRATEALDKARTRDHLQAFSKLTEMVDGRRQIKEEAPPVASASK